MHGNIGSAHHQTLSQVDKYILFPLSFLYSHIKKHVFFKIDSIFRNRGSAQPIFLGKHFKIFLRMHAVASGIW